MSAWQIPVFGTRHLSPMGAWQLRQFLDEHGKFQGFHVAFDPDFVQGLFEQSANVNAVLFAVDENGKCKGNLFTVNGFVSNSVSIAVDPSRFF